MLELFVFAFGAAIGSFLNVVILRLPVQGESLVFPASHCPACRTPIRWFDNIPIVSFLLLRGRCRACAAGISWQYPVVELVMGGLALALFARFSLSIAFLLYFPFVAALLVIVFIDLHHQIIPDVISLPGIAIGFACSFVNPLVSWQESGLGILFGGGSLYMVALGYYLLTKREGMGGGDIKLLAMIGAWLGWPSLPFVILSSSVFGVIGGVGAMISQKKGGKTVIPYGPFLALGSYLYLFFREDIWYFMAVYLR